MTITSARWEAYPWKNEIRLQADRAIAHGLEAVDEEFEGEHSPIHMMERAIVLAAFAIRRLIEKRLVTDSFASSKRSVRAFRAASTERFHPPFHSQSGGHAFRNYDFSTPEVVSMTPGELANEIIHSSQLMVAGSEPFAADGFLVASDWHLTRRVLHLSFAEFGEFAQSVRDDRVASMTDRWDPETGLVSSERLGPTEL